jgi:peptide deformylase
MNVVQAQLKIVQFPHPSLRYVAKPLSAIDQKVVYHATAMLELMYENKGLGLAATQVGLPYQLLVMNYAGDREQRDQEGVFLNPVILERKGSVEGEEGCLSFPTLFQKVRRAKSIKAQAYNLKGQLLELDLTDMAARIWQHEVDHLHGVLFIDKMGTIGRLSSRSKLKEFEREYKKAQKRGEIPPDPEIQKQLQELEAIA